MDAAPDATEAGRASVRELRIGVHCTAEQAQDLLDAIEHLLCPDPEHVPPCPTPWSTRHTALDEQQAAEDFPELVEQAHIEQHGPGTRGLWMEGEPAEQQAFIALLLFESSSPSRRPLYREDVVLLRATSLDDARSRAERHGRDAETSYENVVGETITDRLLHVVDVAPALDDDLSGTTDLYSRHFRDITAYRRFEPLLDGGSL